MTAGTWLAVAAAGAGGAVCRYLVSLALAPASGGRFPWGTGAVNVTGSFLFGVVAGALGVTSGLGFVLAVGFCGSYTTFSTHMVESLELATRGTAGLAVLNVMGSLAAGLVAAVAGLAVTA